MLRRPLRGGLLFFIIWFVQAGRGRSLRERHKLKGTPYGKKKEDIPLFCSIFLVIYTFFLHSCVYLGKIAGMSFRGYLLWLCEVRMHQGGYGSAGKVACKKDISDVEWVYAPTSEERYEEIVNLFLLKLKRRKDARKEMCDDELSAVQG